MSIGQRRGSPRATGRLGLLESLPFESATDLELIVRQVMGMLRGSQQDRRVKRRVPLHAFLRFRLFGNTEWTAGFGSDLSESGLFVRTLTPLEEMDPVEISLTLPGQEAPVEARGLVIWRNLPRPRTAVNFPTGMGLVFSEFEDGQWALTTEWIRGRAHTAP